MGVGLVVTLDPRRLIFHQNTMAGEEEQHDITLPHLLKDLLHRTAGRLHGRQLFITGSVLGGDQSANRIKLEAGSEHFAHRSRIPGRSCQIPAFAEHRVFVDTDHDRVAPRRMRPNRRDLLYSRLTGYGTCHREKRQHQKDGDPDHGTLAKW